MPSARVRRLFWVIAIVLLAVCIEAGSYLIELVSPRILDEPIRRRSAIFRDQTARIASLLDSRSDGRLALDPVLGWRYRAGYSSATDELNGQGLRARHDYAITPADETLRVAGFGDSFIYANEVANGDAWSALLEAREDHLEVANYGVGGYGLDQALLRYRSEGRTLNPDVVLIGFATDDLRRVVNVYRRFISSVELPLTKPRFMLQPNQALVLLPNPFPTPEHYRRLMDEPGSVRELGARDAWYSRTIYENPLYDRLASLRVGHALALRLDRRLFDPERLFVGDLFNERSPAFALQVALLDAFSREVHEATSIPAVIMLPDRHSVARLRRGEPAVYAPLTRALLDRQVTVWDAGDAFRAATHPIDTLFAPGGHYSPTGNRILADWLAVRLAAVRQDAMSARARRREATTRTR
jgi:hypothetical protein